MGNTSQYYTVAVDGDGDYSVSNFPDDEITTAGDEMTIAPMQSFFIPVNANAGNIVFDIESMSVTKANKSVALRSSWPDNAKEILKITAANSRYSATAVIIHKPGEKKLSEDVSKLFSPNGNIPEIYLIQAYTKEILEIGETRTLTAANNVYSFLNSEGDQTNRFFLLFGGYTGIHNPANSLISVSSWNRRIYANASSLDLVQSVKIYNLQGQMILGENNLSVVSCESRPVNGKGVYLVEVKTKLNSVTKKVIVY